MANLQGAVRTAQARESLETVDIIDIIKYLKAKNFRLVKDSTGVERLHVLKNADEYISIKVGNKVTLNEEEPKDRIKELIDDYTIYTGESENGVWLTFGPEPGEGQEAVIVPIAEILGKKFAVA